MILPKIRKPFVGEYPISFYFGENPSWYVKQMGYPHNGIDFAMPVGIPVIACDTGRVVYADNVPDSDGLGVNIIHSWGLSQYWHLSKLTATLGQEVNKGDTLGYSGATGFVTGPHLHFGIKVTDNPVIGMRGWSNPVDYFGEVYVEPAPPAIVPRTYIVKPGDNLWKIAQKFYKNGGFWKKIYEANLDKIKNPNVIRAFTILKIP
jgi:murein DD-endopeptidase MepM/ murein hydrolase activator NlpD